MKKQELRESLEGIKTIKLTEEVIIESNYEFEVGSYDILEISVLQNKIISRNNWWTTLLGKENALLNAIKEISEIISCAQNNVMRQNKFRNLYAKYTGRQDLVSWKHEYFLKLIADDLKEKNPKAIYLMGMYLINAHWNPQKTIMDLIEFNEEVFLGAMRPHFGILTEGIHGRVRVVELLAKHYASRDLATFDLDVYIAQNREKQKKVATKETVTFSVEEKAAAQKNIITVSNNKETIKKKINKKLSSKQDSNKKS